MKGPTVERFCKTTRWFHWAFALSFLTLASTGAVLMLREALDIGPSGTALAVRIHLRAAAVLVAAPALVLLSGRTKEALADLREAFRWSRDDLTWLRLQPLAILGRAELPPAGKLNAGQKVNCLATMALALGLLSTGLWLWFRPGSLVAWFVHLGLFASWIPLFLAHLSLALVLPGTRPALRGMLGTGVDREWARHHHPKWIAEFEAAERADG